MAWLGGTQILEGCNPPEQQQSKDLQRPRRKEVVTFA
jgi:hypothetical protein